MIDYYVGMLSNPDSLRASFGWYRALDTTIAQNEQRKDRLAMPVLAIGGEASFGEHVGEALQAVADDVQSVVIAGAGHFVAEEAPEEILAALTAFLARTGTDPARHTTLGPMAEVRASMSKTAAFVLPKARCPTRR